eukprot:Pgem_evm1s11235
MLIHILFNTKLIKKGDREQYPIPSPLGKIRTVTQDKAEIFQLKKVLQKNMQINANEIKLLEVVGN